MRGLLLLLVVTVTAVVAAPPSQHLSAASKACHDLLDPFETDVTEKTTMDKCIAEQPGLQAILDGLKSAAVTAHGHDHEEGSRDGSPIDLLEKAGKTAELAKLNQCIAKANGHLIVAANGTVSFDVTKFKGEVKAKVAGTTSETNTKLGLDKCPSTSLVAYNVHEYMECVEAYCATGVAPVPHSASVTG